MEAISNARSRTIRLKLRFQTVFVSFSQCYNHYKEFAMEVDKAGS